MHAIAISGTVSMDIHQLTRSLMILSLPNIVATIAGGATLAVDAVKDAVLLMKELQHISASVLAG